MKSVIISVCVCVIHAHISVHMLYGHACVLCTGGTCGGQKRTLISFFACLIPLRGGSLTERGATLAASMPR